MEGALDGSKISGSLSRTRFPRPGVLSLRPTSAKSGSLPEAASTKGALFGSADELASAAVKPTLWRAPAGERQALPCCATRPASPACTLGVIPHTYAGNATRAWYASYNVGRSQMDTSILCIT